MTIRFISMHRDPATFMAYGHLPYQAKKQHYNGISQEDIAGENANTKLGIHNPASKGIAARGVFLDWCRYAEERGIVWSTFDAFAITLEHLKEIADPQNVAFRRGDVLIVRTGWTKAYKILLLEERLALPDRKVISAYGVESSLEAIKWHWDNGFAAVGADMVAYEV